MDNMAEDSGPLSRGMHINNNKFNITFSAYKGIPSLIRQIKNSDIIHTHHHFSGLVARIIGKLYGKRIIHNFGSHYSRFSWYSRLLHFMTFPLVDYVVFVSRSSEKSLNLFEKSLLKNKKTVIYNGINIGEVKKVEGIRNKLGMKKEEFLVGTAGRLIYSKNIKTLILAMKTVLKISPKTRFIIIGSGRSEGELKELSRELGVEKNVIFTGKLSKGEIYGILHSLDLFVSCSLWEGMSASVLEAMAASKPVLLSDMPSFRETIEYNKSGLLFKTKDAEDLANKITYLKENPRIAKDLGKQARKRAKKLFIAEKSAKGYEEVYSKLLKNGL